MVCESKHTCSPAVWFLFLALIRSAMEDAPDFLDRGTFANYEGWSFWAGAVASNSHATN